MLKRITMGFAALLLSGVVVGVGAEQLVPGLVPSSFLNSGLFTVNEGEGVSFHASLEDVRTGPSATVLLRLIDETGVVVARRDVVLGPGQSATLRYRRAGRLRAHADIFEPTTATGARRIVVGSLEVFALADTATVGLKPASMRSARVLAEEPVVRFIAMMNDGGSNGRLPD
jgi:hypothetical protein